MKRFFRASVLVMICLATTSRGFCLEDPKDAGRKFFETSFSAAKTIVQTALPIATGFDAPTVENALLAPQRFLFPSRDRNQPDFSGVDCRLWIFGCGDMPAARYSQAGDAPLFGKKISSGDIAQGELGDCYLMAALGAIADQDPDFIRRMIQDNHDGTYTVTLYSRGPGFGPERLRVDDRFPMRSAGSPPAPLFAAYGKGGSVWVMIAEKAFAMSFGNGSYNAVVAGDPNEALERITGKNRIYSGPACLTSVADLSDWGSKGYAVVVRSLPPALAIAWPIFRSAKLRPRHAYWVRSVNKDRGTVTLGDPEGEGWSVTVTEREFQQAFSFVSVNPIH